MKDTIIKNVILSKKEHVNDNFFPNFVSGSFSKKNYLRREHPI